MLLCLFGSSRCLVSVGCVPTSHLPAPAPTHTSEMDILVTAPCGVAQDISRSGSLCRWRGWGACGSSPRISTEGPHQSAGGRGSHASHIPTDAGLTSKGDTCNHNRSHDHTSQRLRAAREPDTTTTSSNRHNTIEGRSFLTPFYEQGDPSL